MHPHLSVLAFKGLRFILGVCAMSLAALPAGATETRLSYNAAGELVAAATASATAPVISLQPKSALAEVGRPLVLSVGAAGAAPLTYQWFKGTDAIPGATNATLVFGAFTATDAGIYSVVVTNSFDSATSDPAALTLAPAADAFMGPALGAPELAWRQSGATFWRQFSGPTDTHDGVSAVGLGASYSDDSYLETDVTGPKTVSFWIRMNNDSGIVQLKTNGVAVREMATQAPRDIALTADAWTQVVLDVPPGEWNLRWHHIGNGSVQLDDVSVTTPADSDTDGLSDDFEQRFFESLTEVAIGNTDADGADHLREYRDMTYPDDGDFTHFGAFNAHIFTTADGGGTVALFPVQNWWGYEQAPIGYGFTASAKAEPQDGQVFTGWTDVDHGHEWVANPLDGITFTGQPVPEGKNSFTAPRSRSLVAHFEPAVPLAEAADLPGSNWTTGGEVPWIGQRRHNHDGVDALRTGGFNRKGGSQTSWIRTEVTGPVKVTWRQYVKRATLTLQVNDYRPEPSYSNDGEWTLKTLHVPPGIHSLRWETVVGAPYLDTQCAMDELVVTPTVDSDNDGMDDDWEWTMFQGLHRDGTGNLDFDAATDLMEYLYLTSPHQAFARLPLTVDAGPGGTATVDPVRSLYVTGHASGGSGFAETVTLRALADADRRFEEWQDGNGAMLKLTDSGGDPWPALYSLSLRNPPAGNRLTARFGPLLSAAVDAPQLTFEASLSWRTRTGTTHDHVDSAETRPLSGSEYARMSTNVTGPVVVSFWWKSSGENGKFRAALYDESSSRVEIGGFTDWRREFVVLGPGNHTLNWWAFNNSSNYGSNQAWVDEVRVETDTDLDGLGDDWERQHFGDLAANASDDADLDGNSNQVEYGDQTDPESGGSARYALTIVSDEMGAVLANPAPGPHAPGTDVILTADPALLNWGGAASGMANPLTVSMTTNKTVTATFQPLARGVDNTKLFWATDPDRPWAAYFPAEPTGTPAEDWIHSPGGMANGQTSWVETSVTGPCSVQFVASVTTSWTQSAGYASDLIWSVDGVEAGDWSPDGAANVSVYVPAGTHLVRWTYFRGADETEATASARLDQVKVVPQPDSNLPLAQALDTPVLTWTTAGDSPWLGGAGLSHDGEDAAYSWGTPPGGASTLQTTVTGPGTLTFWWKVSGEGGSHSLNFLIDGVAAVTRLQPEFPATWKQVSVEIAGSGARTLRWVFENYYDYWSQGTSNGGWVDQVVFTPTPTIALPEALDNSDLTWTTSTSAWYGVSNPSHDGTDAARSGPIGDGQASWVQTQVTGPGTMTFWWKASTKASDYFFIYMDGYRPFDDDYIKGETDWTQKTLTIPAGTHTLQWRYSKDSDSSWYVDPGHLDRVWLDQVTWQSSSTGEPEIAVERPVGTNVATGASNSFGSVSLGSTVTHTFTLKNTGTAPLNISNMMVAFDQAADFQLTQPSLNPVPAGGSTTFTVAFSPGAATARYSWLYIMSNDEDEGTFILGLAGTGTQGAPVSGPEISVEEPQFMPRTDGSVLPVDYGPVVLGARVIKSFWIRNLGNAPLTGISAAVSGAHAADFPIIHKAATSLAAGASTYVVVTFQPKAQGERTALLKINSNDVDEKPFDILLEGSGIPPTPPQFTESPTSMMLAVGMEAAFFSTATGDPEPTFQWRKGTAAVAGAKSSDYTIPAVTLAHAGAYTVQATNSGGKDTSDVAQLGVVDTSGKTHIVAAGGNLNLTCNAAGTGLTYEWWREGDAQPLVASSHLVDVNKKTLIIKGLLTGDRGVYRCKVAGAAGELTAGDQSVTVFDQAPDITPLADGHDLPPGIVGRAYAFQVPFDDAPERTPTKFTATGLPPGLSIDNEGLIQGTPTAAKLGKGGVVVSYVVKITASNKLKDTVTVNLSISPLPAGAVGTFEGAIAGNSTLNSDLGGRFDLKTDKSGTFSGKIALGAVTHSFKGILVTDATGLAPQGAAQILRKGLNPLTVTFTIDSGNDRIDTADVTDGSNHAAVKAWRNTWTTVNKPTKWDGYYTFGLDIQSGRPEAPQGTGFGSFTVSSSTGVASLKCKTADGESIVGSAFVGPQGQLVIYKLLYGTPKGSLAGAMTIGAGADDADDSDNTLGGSLRWLRPANSPAKTRTYNGGFDPVQLDVSGGRFVPTSLALGLAAGDSARLAFSEAGIGIPAPSPDITVVIGTRNAITYPAANPRKTSLTLKPASGEFSGKFTLEDPNPLPPPALPRVIKRSVSYEGVIITRDGVQRGFGYFLLPQLPDAGPPPTTPTTSPILSGQALFERP